MDLGVGSFVFSQGIISAIPLLKDPAYLLVPTIPKIISVTKKVMPLFVLGIIRVISVKGTEYPVNLFVFLEGFSGFIVVIVFVRNTSRSTEHTGISFSRWLSSRYSKSSFIR